MIVSFHPCVVADKNILCAGREPDDRDLAWIKKADAVLLPQGCRKTLYEMAAANCPHVFPDFSARFAFPGKIGQARLFNQFLAPFPETKSFSSLDAFNSYGAPSGSIINFDFPFVFKFDWGGESDNVVLINSKDQLANALRQAAKSEKTGQFGFLIQEYIPSTNRSLRVAVIGQKRIAYWRVQPDLKNFSTGVSKGAIIDKNSDPKLRRAGIEMVNSFCGLTRINLAGFDIVFAETKGHPGYFLEINYFFGRTGLGGSENFYETLTCEINAWLKRIGLTSCVGMH